MSPHLQERGADEGLLLVDGGGTEDVARPQVERDVLDHVGQELKVVDVADEVHPVHPRQTDKYVLENRREGEGLSYRLKCDYSDQNHLHHPHSFEGGQKGVQYVSRKQSRGL